MQGLDLPQIVLLDGGMGRELRFRGVDILNTIWSANALLTAPESKIDLLNSITLLAPWRWKPGKQRGVPC
jgi:hypothetical protein